MISQWINWSVISQSLVVSQSTNQSMTSQWINESTDRTSVNRWSSVNRPTNRWSVNESTSQLIGHQSIVGRQSIDQPIDDQSMNQRVNWSVISQSLVVSQSTNQSTISQWINESTDRTSVNRWSSVNRPTNQSDTVHACLVFNGSFSTNMLYHALVKNLTYSRGPHMYHAIKQWSNTINQDNHKHSSAWALWRWFLVTVRLPLRSLSSQSLGKYWELN